MSVDEKLVERIKKLLALSGSNNEHEASAALAKAQAIMAEHNLSSGDLRVSDIAHGLCHSRFSISNLKAYENHLAHVVSGAFGCTPFWKSGRARTTSAFILVGHKRSVPVAVYTMQVLFRKMSSARAAYVQTLWGPGRVAKVDAYCLGWAQGVSAQVKALAQGDQDREAIDAYVAKMMPAQGNPKESQKRELDHHSFFAGINAGEAERLLRPMGTDTRGQISKTRLIGG